MFFLNRGLLTASRSGLLTPSKISHHIAKRSLHTVHYCGFYPSAILGSAILSIMSLVGAIEYVDSTDPKYSGLTDRERTLRIRDERFKTLCTRIAKENGIGEPEPQTEREFNLERSLRFGYGFIRTAVLIVTLPCWLPCLALFSGFFI